MLRAAFIVMQFIISAKAGLVNAVEGPVNVQVHEQVPAEALIQTAPRGQVEILLNPGSFLRLGENSEAVLDSVELTNIAIRILTGSAIIESSSVEKDSPIRVTDGSLSVLITAPGLYKFSANTASVLDGELRTEDFAHSISKGWEIRATTGDQGTSYDEAKLDSSEPVSPLEQWSGDRSQQIASAAGRSSETDSASNLPPPYPSDPLYPAYPSYPTPFSYPGGAIPPYGYGPRIVPSFTPFSFFQWYNGGYSFYQPFTPFMIGPPVLRYPYYAGPGRPILRPSPGLPRPPATTPFHPAPRPVPSRPGGISRGRR
jgi:hypothetical protein